MEFLVRSGKRQRYSTRRHPAISDKDAPEPELARVVVDALSGVNGRVGLAIKDLNTGRGVLISPETELPAASVFKVEVMYEVYKQRELGALSFDETLVLTQRYVDFDLGT